MHSFGEAFAPSNIALAKYWGKRDRNLNLPLHSSVSFALNRWGATTRIMPQQACDAMWLNGCLQSDSSPFSKRIRDFLDRVFEIQVPGQRRPFFSIETTSNIPVAAGLASSAAGFAALIKALDQCMEWALPDSRLSVLARLGSGSAARSLWTGFVYWQRGCEEEGTDSYAMPLPVDWPAFRMGVVLLEEKEKAVPSRVAMEFSTHSPLFDAWKHYGEEAATALRNAVLEKHFDLVGRLSEASALFMHTLMQTGHPVVIYSTPQSIAVRAQVYRWREQGLPVYWTQDAGPNIKILFLEGAEETVRTTFGHQWLI